MILTALVAGFCTLSVGRADTASAASTDTLYAGQQLNPGQALWSSNGAYQALMQTDGNFVEYGPSGAIWSSNTSPGNGTDVIMQGDGNLVVYAPGGRAVWSSSTAPSNGDRLVMQSDGNLVMYSAGGLALWATPGGATGNRQDTLATGQQLNSGQFISSLDGRYKALMQTDGNFVEYGPSGAIWASNTSPGNGTDVIMQGDGNLVVYAPGGRAVWSSGTAPSNGDRLVMQSDGNLVMYSAGTALWTQSNTVHTAAETAAVSWSENYTGQTTWDYKCLAFVYQAYLQAGIDITKLATNPRTNPVNYWNTYTGPSANRHAANTSAAYGALVFWAPNTKYGDYDGHIAISIGGGQVVTSMAAGANGVHNATISSISAGGAGYLGWINVG